MELIAIAADAETRATTALDAADAGEEMADDVRVLAGLITDLADVLRALLKGPKPEPLPSTVKRWRADLTPDQARKLGAKIPKGVTLPVQLTVEVDEEQLRELYQAALTNKGGVARAGAVTARRGRA